MEDPLLDDYQEEFLSIDKETLMSFFYKDNREQEGAELPLSLMKIKPTEIMQRLKTSKHYGISQDPKELEARRQKYGTNTIIPDYTPKKNKEPEEYADANLSKEKSILVFIKEHFEDRIWLVLLVFSIILIIISIIEDKGIILDVENSNWLVGVSTLGMVILICIFNVLAERQKHRSLLHMLREVEGSVQIAVIREGKEFLILQSQILVGDIIVLSGGDSVPADWLVVEANLQAQADESFLTPDINPVQKRAFEFNSDSQDKEYLNVTNTENDSMDTPDPFLLASTLILAGRLKALVWAVGNNTYARTKNLHSPYYTMMGEKKTFLESRMDRIINQFGRTGFILSLLILISLVCRTILLHLSKSSASLVLTDHSTIGILFHSFTYTLTLLALLIPNSLSSSLSSIIHFSIKKMFLSQAVCLTKWAPENMARINQLCIEKGGTLTTKKMEVIYIDTLDGTHSSLATIDEAKRNIIIENLALNVVHLNSVGRIVKNLNNENKHIGSRMEWAFLEFLTENSVDYEAVRKSAKEILQTNPSTEKQRMVMTMIEHPTDPECFRLYLNGSTDVFFTHCSRVQRNEDRKELFTYSQKEYLETDIIRNYKLKKLRVLALGYKDVKKEDYK